MPKPSDQFTLRSLIVLVTVIALLLAFVLPYIQAKREETRRAQCLGRLKQLTVAVLNYESAYGRFPAAAPSCTSEAWHSTGVANGNTCQGPNWALEVTFFMEEVTLWADVGHCLIDHHQISANCHKCGFGDVTPDWLSCPSATANRKLHTSQVSDLKNLSKGNYAGSMGASTYLHSIDGNYFIEDRLRAELSNEEFKKARRSRGILTVGMIANWEMREAYLDTSSRRWTGQAGVTESHVQDGLSNTVILSEVIGFDDPTNQTTDIRGVWVSASMGASTFSHFTTPNSPTPDAINDCSPTGHVPCTQVAPTGRNAGDTFAAARSEHPGGVNVAMADGAVRHQSNQIDPQVWKSLGTRAGDSP